VQPEPQSAAVVEETCLLAQTATGDREAFRALYSRYGSPLYSLAVRIVGDTSDAEDVLQDSFIKIWRNAGSFDPRKSRPFTWAVTIVRRTCFDHLRKRRRLPPLAELPATASAAPGSYGGDNARQETEAHEDSGRLRGALAQIPANQRRALELALFTAMSHPEIAQALGQPVGTVKSWIRRGLLEVRNTLTEPSL